MAKLCEHGYFLEVAPRSCPKCRTDLDLIQREEIATLKVTISRLREYVRDCAKNWDCDEDAHTYGTTCRKCDAEALLAAMAGGE